MTSPTISIISSAARPENWQGLYESIGENDVSCEYVFVGPNAPQWDLPDNFTYIKSNVKPAQCFEIAARRASGELLLWFTDDSLFITEHPLDKMYELYLEQNNHRVIVSSNYHLPEGWNRFFSGNFGTPSLALCGLISNLFWKEIGGIDSKFIALCWAEDMSMSAHALGGDVVMSDVYMDEEVEMPSKPRSRGSSLLRDHYSTDRALLDRLWSVEGKTHLNRTLPYESFKCEEILTVSQEPKGRWTGNNDLQHRFLTSRNYYATRRIVRVIRGRIHRFRFAKLPEYLGRIFKRS